MVAALSAEVFTVPLSSSAYLVYAPLRRAAFVANARLVNLLASIRDGAVRSDDPSSQDALELLRRLEIIDGGPETLPITSFEGVPEAVSVTLFLTTTCNLRCTYCYASAGDTAAKSMSLETAKRGIDFVAQNAARKGLESFEINYHGGGEPTGNWRVMTDSLAYAQAKAVAMGLTPPHASSASNGVLRDDQIDWIIDNLNGGVSLSFDGLPSVHDRHRLTVLGQGSSSQVMHTIRRFDSAGFPYGLRLTVTADQVQHLARSVEFVCENFSATRIQVEPAYQLGRWRDAPSAETMEFIEEYRRAQGVAVRHERRLLFSAARTDGLSNHFCGVTKDTFALSPDGNVSSCYEVFSEDSPHAPVFFYGSPDPDNSGYRFNLPVLDHLRHQAVQHRDYCQGCFAKWTCAGDCYHKAVSVSGSTEFHGSDRCHITRELTKDELLANIAASGGVFWHGGSVTGDTASRGKEVLL